jgi:hypothetical protein
MADGGAGSVDCYTLDYAKEAMITVGEYGGMGVFNQLHSTGYIPLADLFSVDATEVGREDRNGTSCVTLFSETKYGRTKVWLDPAKNYAVVGYVLERESGKHARPFAKPGEEYAKPVVKDEAGKEHTIVSSKEELTRVEYREINGQYVPLASELAHTDVWDDGTVRRHGTAYRIRDVDLNPSFPPETFDASFAEGLEMFWHGANGFSDDYELRSGRIVPRVSEGDLNQVRELAGAADEIALPGADESIPADPVRGAEEKAAQAPGNDRGSTYRIVVVVIALATIALSLYAKRRRSQQRDKRNL